MLNRSSHFIFLCSSKLLRNGRYHGVFLSKGLARKDTSSPDPRSEANSPWTWRCGGWTMWANSSRCWRCAKSAFPFAQMSLLVFVSVCVCRNLHVFSRNMGTGVVITLLNDHTLPNNWFFGSSLLFVGEMEKRKQWPNLKPPFFGWHVYSKNI